MFGVFLPARLQGEGHLSIPKGVSLPVYCANGNAKVVGVLFGQLGYVVRHRARRVLLGNLVKFVNVPGEPQKVRYDELHEEGRREDENAKNVIVLTLFGQLFLK